jgi:ABC-type uncharacterized transport system substrate-binding protein
MRAPSSSHGTNSTLQLFCQGQVERFKEFAAEMVRLNVDIIIVVTTPAALAVKNATKTIPIVHPNAIDPLNTGLIASLAHPNAWRYLKKWCRGCRA